ncbi:MAG: hypothetical protein ACI8RD_007336, partial [Bacillariaceae sp.]
PTPASFASLKESGSNESECPPSNQLYFFYKAKQNKTKQKELSC